MASYGLVLPEVFPQGTLITDIKQIVTSTDDNGENVIQAELFNGQKVEFKIRNGSKGNTGEAAGFTTPTAEIDDNTGKPSVEVTASGKDTAKKFHFSFKNLKGNKGDTGAAAGFAAPMASVNNETGTPSVEVTATGEDSAKVFNFAFKNLKGDKGDDGASLISVKQTQTSTESDGENIIEMTLADGTKSSITIHNGSKGDKGDDVSDPLLQSIDKQVASLIENSMVSRPSIRPDELDKTITNGIYQVYYGAYGGALLVFNVTGSVGIVQFFKPYWDAAAHWQYRNAIDSDTHRWTSWQTIATTEDISKYISNFTKDFGDPNGKRTIQVGFVGKGLTAETTSHLAGFYNDGNGDRGYKIRDISAEEVKKFLKLTKKDIIDTVYPIGIVIHAASGLNPEQAFEGTKWRYVGVVINLNEWQRIA